MKTFAVAGLVLMAMSGVALADSPGGWDQFTAMTKAQASRPVAVQKQPVVAQKQPVAPRSNVEMFPVTSWSGTWVAQPNPNEGSNN